MKKCSQIKKLAVMSKLITAGFMSYYTCDNEVLQECVLHETQVNGIGRIYTEIKMFQRQKAVALDDLENERFETLESSKGIFKRNIEHLEKFLELCKTGLTEIEKVLFEPLQSFIDEQLEVIELIDDFLENPF